MRADCSSTDLPASKLWHQPVTLRPDLFIACSRANQQRVACAVLLDGLRLDKTTHPLARANGHLAGNRNRHRRGEHSLERVTHLRGRHGFDACRQFGTSPDPPVDGQVLRRILNPTERPFLRA